MAALYAEISRCDQWDGNTNIYSNSSPVRDALAFKVFSASRKNAERTWLDVWRGLRSCNCCCASILSDLCGPFGGSKSPRTLEMLCECPPFRHVNVAGIESHPRVDQGSEVVDPRFSGKLDVTCLNSARNVVISKMSMAVGRSDCTATELTLAGSFFDGARMAGGIGGGTSILLLLLAASARAWVSYFGVIPSLAFPNPMMSQTTWFSAGGIPSSAATRKLSHKTVAW